MIFAKCKSGAKLQLFYLIVINSFNHNLLKIGGFPLLAIIRTFAI